MIKIQNLVCIRQRWRSWCFAQWLSCLNGHPQLILNACFKCWYFYSGASLLLMHTMVAAVIGSTTWVAAGHTDKLQIVVSSWFYHARVNYARHLGSEPADEDHSVSLSLCCSNKMQSKQINIQWSKKKKLLYHVFLCMPPVSSPILLTCVLSCCSRKNSS